MGKLKNKTKLEKGKKQGTYYTPYLPLPQYIIPETSAPITYASL
jgi:hypothetical protein